jgi:signal transduction histidine kinase
MFGAAMKVEEDRASIASAMRGRDLRPMKRSLLDSDAPFRMDRQRWLLVLSFWTLMGLVESTKAWVSQELRGQPVMLVHALVGNMPWWWFWAAMTPVTFWIASRFPLERERGVRYLPVHLLAAVSLSMLHFVAVGWLYYQTHARGRVAGFGVMMRNWVESFGMLNFLTYWAIVGAWLALTYHSRYQASQSKAAQLERDAAQLEASMAEARLDALRMELNPHFLFNTLNAISGLVRRRDYDEAVQVLARFGDLLRITLDREAEQTTSLAKELEFLRLYLDIERVRFHDRLEVEIDVDPSLLDVRVPTLILQPLVENAVRHGIARKPGAGSIHIEVRHTRAGLRLTVTDTGVGFGAEARLSRGDGVGLSNTHARLSQLYGASATLELAETEGGGATVTVNLPLADQDSIGVHGVVQVAGGAR